MANSDIPDWAKKSLEDHDTKIARLEGITDRLDALIRISKEEHQKQMAELAAVMKEELEIKQKVVMMVAALDKDRKLWKVIYFILIAVAIALAFVGISK